MSRENRRRDQRVSLPAAIGYHVVGRDLRDTWFPGVLANLAAGGLCFTCDRVVGEGDQLGFRLTLPIREEPYFLKGVVMWATPLSVGVDCGVAFTEMNSDRQFELDEMVEFLNTNTLRPRPPKNAD